MLLAIDPGDIESAWIIYDPKEKMPKEFAKEANENILEKLAEFREKCSTLVIEMIASYGMPVGRAQPLSSQILTPNGYKKMGDITTKDKVVGLDGNAYNILGINKQGKKNKYKVIFSDNTYTYCCKEHLWSLTTPKRKLRGNPNITKSTSELLQSNLYNPKNRTYRYSLPQHEAIKCFNNKEEKIIHPYIIGVLIGDGSMQYTSLLFTHSEDFIPNKCRKFIHDYMELKTISGGSSNTHRFKHKKGGRDNPYLTFIRNIGLNVRCEKKFIPERYLYAKVEDRINLLHGLMDTDGYICKQGRLQYNTVSKKLKKDFIFLINSLGGNSRCFAKKNSVGNDSFTISFSLPDDIRPCSFPKKLDRVKKKKFNINKSLKEIVNTEEFEDMQCIITDAPENLYITDNFILTHNSVFDTCVWIGRYWQLWESLGGKVELLYRKDVKMALCHTMRAKDSNVRQAIMDRYGSSREVAIGKKKTPGPLYGISKDVWAALGVAITWSEKKP